MSLRNFLVAQADFYLKDLNNFLDITKKEGIDENFLNNEEEKIIGKLSELTKIPMNMETKLTKESSDDLKKFLNEHDNLNSFLAYLKELKSETKKGYTNSNTSFDSLAQKNNIENHFENNYDTIGESSRNIEWNFDNNISSKSNKTEQSKTKKDRNTIENDNNSYDKTSTKYTQGNLYETNNQTRSKLTQANQLEEKNKASKGVKSLISKSENKFYYQIHQENLSSIYDCGLICPAKHNSQRTQPDIQDKYNSCLLLFDRAIIYNGNGSKQVLLELFLTQDDLPKPLTMDGLFLFNKPLPVSRISKIIYSDKTYWEKLMGLVASDAISFIPESIATYNADIKVKDEIFDSSADAVNIDYNEKLNIYNKRLGALAFMKNANLYYGVFSNYSDNYFSAINELDPNFHLKSKIEIPKSIRIAMNTNFEDKNPNDIYNDVQINKEYLEKWLEKNNFPLDKLPKGPFSINKKNYLKAIEENNNKLFNTAFIAIYGDKSPASTASIQLKSQFASEVKNRQNADTLLALLGAYYGYKAIRSHDQIAVNSTNFLHKEIDTNTNIKFKMDSQLDYLTIETVYQKTFNNEAADKNFICSFAPKFKGNAQTLDIFNRYNRNKYFNCIKQTVYDVEYVRIIKKDTKSVLIETVNENYDDKIPASKALFTWIYNFFFEKGIVRIFKDGIFIKKEDLILEIEKSDDYNLEKLDLERFDDFINLDTNSRR